MAKFNLIWKAHRGEDTAIIIIMSAREKIGCLSINLSECVDTIIVLTLVVSVMCYNIKNYLIKTDTVTCGTEHEYARAIGAMKIGSC